MAFCETLTIESHPNTQNLLTRKSAAELRLNSEYERRTDYDTTQIITLYKYNIPKENTMPSKEGVDIVYLNDNGMTIGYVSEYEYLREYTTAFYKYNEHGLIIERDQKYIEPDGRIMEEVENIDYEYDDSGNPVLIKTISLVIMA